MVPPASIDDLRAWYRSRFDALERIHAMELAAMTDEQALRQSLSLCSAGIPWRDRPDYSGLIEQQALFHRRKKT